LTITLHLEAHGAQLIKRLTRFTAMEIMKIINCTTPSSNDNSAPMIREPTVPLINNNSKFRATLPSLTVSVFGPYHQDALEDQLEERNNQLQQQEYQLQQCNSKLQHNSLLLLKQFFQLDQLKNQLQQRDAQLRQQCQKCFSDDCRPICSQAPYHVFEEKLIVGNHGRE
jgi:hypothetical protein